MKAYPQFISLTVEEVKSRHLLKRPIPITQLNKIRLNPKPKTIQKTILSSTSVTSVDLTLYVTSTVYNQNICGNCYAFGTVDGINMRNKLAGRSTPALSIEQLTDCSSNMSLAYINYGCNGGYLDNAMWYVAAYGLYAQSVYPLNTLTYASGVAQPCHSVSSTRYYISGWYDIGTEIGGCFTRANMLLSNYTVPTYMSASNTAMMYYSSGTIFSCPNEGTVDHVVLMVGFRYDGTTAGSYFKVKNSWGTAWGMGGYFQISFSNTCNICYYSTASM